MVNDNFWVKEHTIINFYKTDSVRNFERHLTKEFNNNVKAMKKEIVQLKNLVALNEATIFLN